jgi:putative endonuclease
VWFVYTLRCCDDSLYIGDTDDVPSRMTRHNDGRGSSFTAIMSPHIAIAIAALLLRFRATFFSRRRSLILQTTRSGREIIHDRP